MNLKHPVRLVEYLLCYQIDYQAAQCNVNATLCNDAQVLHNRRNLNKLYRARVKIAFFS